MARQTSCSPAKARATASCSRASATRKRCGRAGSMSGSSTAGSRRARARDLVTRSDRRGDRGARRARGARAWLRAALLAGELANTRVGGVVVLRRAVEAPARTVARDLHLAPRLARITALHLVGYAFSIFGWWAIGSSVLAGHIDLGWLTARAELVVT